MATVEIATEDVARKFIDAANRHDSAGMAALIAPDASFHGPLNPQGLRGREAITRWAEMPLKAFPDFELKVSRIIAKGDTVVVEAVQTGTHGGPLELPTGTLAPTNKHFEAPLAMFFRVNTRGLITDGRSYWDPAAALTQLGIKPAGGT